MGWMEGTGHWATQRGDEVNMPHSLIVGGSKGLGRELARLLAESGHVVSVIARHAPAGPEADPTGIRSWAADILDPSALEGALGELLTRNGPLDNLVFLQRYRGQGDVWQGELDTTLTATCRLIERLSDSFREGAGGSIIVVGSLLGRLVWAKQPFSYHAAKAALEQLAAYYAVALGPKGIRVNCVSPLTFLKEESKQFYLEDERVSALYREIIPLGRMGTSLDVARVIRFLCSEDAAFVSGQTLVVDGGCSRLFQEGLARRLAGLD